MGQEEFDLDGDALELIKIFMGSEKQEGMHRKEDQGQYWGRTSLIPQERKKKWNKDKNAGS